MRRYYLAVMMDSMKHDKRSSFLCHWKKSIGEASHVLYLEIFQAHHLFKFFAKNHKFKKNTLWLILTWQNQHGRIKLFPFSFATNYCPRLLWVLNWFGLTHKALYLFDSWKMRLTRTRHFSKRFAFFSFWKTPTKKSENSKKEGDNQ